MKPFSELHSFFHNHPISTGIFGSLASFVSSGAAFFHYANVVFAFIAGGFGAGTAIYTFLILRRTWKRGEDWTRSK